ncbi:MAG: UDP-N-acetylmuramoyl-L-alanyl-D-glutamate--2,6-diaminopimelate ligase [Clostridiales bacterium]|nr:UDP-N-acetylmuramoyl-L-alanyl-D-glutamate--2,6-diaminopimelate ligase [Clostridiales bacterium]
MRTLRLKDYLIALQKANLVVSAQISAEKQELEVKQLTFDSQEAGEGCLFVCKGAHFKAQYLQDACAKGAICYVSEVPYEVAAADCKDVAVSPASILVSDIRKAMALLGNLFYDEPWRRLHTIGVTGTKGKSTTVYYIRQILDCWLEKEGQKESAVLSGIDVYDGVVCEESHLTTPEAIPLQRHFANAAESGMEYLEMEVSSQALKYDRTAGVTFEVGAFLNIGEDHISPIEHPDFDDYFDSKLRLMDQCRIACVNGDCNHFEEIYSRAQDSKAEKVIAFGQKPGMDLYGHHLRKTEQGIAFQADWQGKTMDIELTMPGLFNIENALAAMACCLALGVSEEAIKEGLYSARVPGRMEPFYGKESGTMVLVDYAHNRMSFEKLFSSCREEYPEHRIVAIYGCPGKKALARRWELAEVAANYAEKVYVTEEDHGEEDLTEICVQIASNVLKYGGTPEIIEDRELAIKEAIEEAASLAAGTVYSGPDAGKACKPVKTLILLTGKGRETRQKRGTKYIDCASDVEIVEQYLK